MPGAATAGPARRERDGRPVSIRIFGASPWSVVEDVTFRDNIVRHVAAGINILGSDDIHSSRQTSRIAIVNNVFADVGGTWGSGRLFQLLDGTRDVVIDHNTAFQTGGALTGGDPRPHSGFVFQNNIVMAGPHGISGSGVAHGSGAVARYFPGAMGTTKRPFSE